jgi:hypothetical protein
MGKLQIRYMPKLDVFVIAEKGRFFWSFIKGIDPYQRDWVVYTYNILKAKRFETKDEAEDFVRFIASDGRLDITGRTGMKPGY